MKVWPGFIGLIVLAAALLLIASCGPAGDPAVEAILEKGSVSREAFQALSPEQKAELARLAKERHRVIIGDEERY